MEIKLIRQVISTHPDNPPTMTSSFHISTNRKNKIASSHRIEARLYSGTDKLILFL
jgi:hypothetical protein